MPSNGIRVSNDTLWNATESIDLWLENNIGLGNFTEYIGFISLPYRSFSFNDPKHEILFILRWG